MRLNLENNADAWKYYIMLSYPREFPCDGRKVKRDIQAMKRWLKRQGVTDIFWGLEFQQRGAPHINFLIPQRIDKDKLSQAWYRIVGSGDPLHLKAGSGIDRVRNTGEMISYMIGYVGKAEQKEVPEDYINVGRFWGCTKQLKETGTYTYKFKSLSDLEAFMSPVAEKYQSMMNEWSAKKGKAYKWQYRGKSFVMWSGSKYISDIIQGGNNDVTEQQKEKTVKKKLRYEKAKPEESRLSDEKHVEGRICEFDDRSAFHVRC